MGCCCSLFQKDNGPQGSEANERTHLLVDPVSNNTNIPRVHNDDYVNQYANSVPKKTDEQSALNRILHETAANVIDVGALDSHNLEQHEYMDRSRAYAKRIESGDVKVPHANPCLLKDIPAPERILSADSITPEDHELSKSTWPESHQEKRTAIQDTLKELKPLTDVYSDVNFITISF